MTLKYKLSMLVSCLALIGCVSPPLMDWVKLGATQEEYSKDKYYCMQQSQQRIYKSGFNVTSGGWAVEKTVTNDELFNACMNANGWYLRPSNPQPSSSWF